MEDYKEYIDSILLTLAWLMLVGTAYFKGRVDERKAMEKEQDELQNRGEENELNPCSACSNCKKGECCYSYTMREVCKANGYKFYLEFG